MELYAIHSKWLSDFLPDTPENLLHTLDLGEKT